MNQPQNNNQQNLKWIALSVVILFALSGGVYKFSKRDGSSSAWDSSGSSSDSSIAQHSWGPPDSTAPGVGKTSLGNGSGSSAPYTASYVSPKAAVSAELAAIGVDLHLVNVNPNGSISESTATLLGSGKTENAVIASIATAISNSNYASSTATTAAEANSASRSPASSGGSAVQGVGNTLPGGAGSAVGLAPGTPGSVSSAIQGQVQIQAADPLVPGAPAVMAPLPGAVAVTEKADQCVTITYHHKSMTAHPDEESCSHHKNMIKLTQLTDLRINAASVCVRVNGTPVHYLTVKGHADELIFGSVAGPKSKVTVHYCTGKAQGCAKEECAVPKDEFMEAIGGGDDASQNAKLGQWDPDTKSEKEADVMAKLDGEVKKELETNDDLNGRAPAGELFKEWIGQAETAACGTTQAKN